MKVLVIGANGGTGRELTSQLLAQKHEVIAFVRNAESIDVKHKNLKIIVGNVKDIDSLKKAAKNVDAVLSALGPRSLGKTTLQEDFAKNIVVVMDERNILRLISLSAWGAGNSKKHAPLLIKLFFSTILKNVYRDKLNGEAIIENSTLDYTFVRPGRLLDAPSRKTLKVSLNKKPHLSRSIARKDVAKFMIDQIDSKKYVRKAPVIGY